MEGLKGNFGEWLETKKKDILQFLKEYISYRSVQNNEKEVQKNFIKPFLLKRMEWDHVEEVFVEEEEQRININATLKANGNGGNSLLINGHSDVVGVSKEQRKRWETDPWQATVKDGKIYGRGAADMKGPNAAAIWAVKGLMDLGVEIGGDLFLSLVIGEETSEQELGVIPSTERLTNGSSKPIDCCLNVEPTDLEIHIASTGNFDFFVEINGKEIHTSMKSLAKYPQRYGLPSGEKIGIDASQILADIIKRLDRLEHKWNMQYKHPVVGGGGWPQSTDAQGTGNTSINCTKIRAGSDLGSLPGNAFIDGHIYYPPNAEPSELKEEFVETVNSVKHSFIGLESSGSISIEFENRWHWKPFEISRDHSACQFLSEVLEEKGVKPIFSGMKSVVDNSYIQEFGVPTFSCGPGKLMSGTHGPNEFINIEKLYKAIEVYAGFISKWGKLPEGKE